MTKTEKLYHNLGVALLATAEGKTLFIEAPPFGPPPVDPPSIPTVPEPPPEEVDPYDPFAYDRGVEVKLIKYAVGDDPSQPEKGLHLEVDVRAHGVSDWGGLVSPQEGGYNAFAFGVATSLDIGEMEILTDRATGKDKLDIRDDDVATKEVVGASGDQTDVVLEDGPMVTLAWYNINEDHKGKLLFLTLVDLSLSDTKDGIVIDGVNSRVPHYPKAPFANIVL